MKPEHNFAENVSTAVVAKRKEITVPKKRIDTREALVEFLATNGMTNWGANQFMFVNIPALGEYASLQNAIDEGRWDEAWNVAVLYLNGFFDAEPR